MLCLNWEGYVWIGNEMYENLRKWTCEDIIGKWGKKWDYLDWNIFESKFMSDVTFAKDYWLF